ncbi:MAG: protocatechuate 3,4-dioxygenase subunit alpha [Paracoccaceae bacterium]
MSELSESASQTAGPYVHVGLVPNRAGLAGVYPEDLGAVMAREGAKGERITLSGRIFDGTGAVLRDALVEIWQADAAGLYPSPRETRGRADPAFAGWGRCACDFETGEYRFETVKPGRTPFRDGRMMAPYVAMWIVARGINLGLSTRVHFEDEAEANAEDPVLTRLDARARTLIAKKEGPGAYRFDVRLQGEDETVFFDV